MNNFDFWNTKRTTSEVYLRTNRNDWFKIVDWIVKEIGSQKRVLDIGSGDGHSTRQVLARLTGEYECDLVEPNVRALRLSKELLNEFRIREYHLNTLDEFIRKREKYDVIYSLHTNYYWGIQKKARVQNFEQYNWCLDNIIKIAPKRLILTQPADSDYYKICEKNTFPEWVYSEYIEQHYKKKGIPVRRENFSARFFINDIGKDSYAAKETWRFFNNTESEPTEKEISAFLERINATKKAGNLDFKDVLLVIQ